MMRLVRERCMMDEEESSPGAVAGKETTGALGDEGDEDESDCNSLGGAQFIRKLFELITQEPGDIVGFLLDGASFEVSV
jgi:hypothetical protein